MTDLSNLPPEVREALQEVQVVFDVNEHQPWADKEAHEILRDYILRVTAERDALERQIADAPVVNVSMVLTSQLDGTYKSVPLIRESIPVDITGMRVKLVKVE